MSPQKKCNRVAPPPPPRWHQPLISKEKIDSSSLDASVQPIHETCRTKWLQKEKKKTKNGTTGNAPLRPCSGLKPSGYHDNSLIAFKYTPKASGFDPLDPRGCDTALQQVSHKNTPLVWFSEKNLPGSKGLKELQPPPASIQSKDKTPRAPRKQAANVVNGVSQSCFNMKRNVDTGKFLH